jgi:hypothetical protein
MVEVSTKDTYKSVQNDVINDDRRDGRSVFSEEFKVPNTIQNVLGLNNNPTSDGSANSFKNDGKLDAELKSRNQNAKKIVGRIKKRRYKRLLRVEGKRRYHKEW